MSVMFIRSIFFLTLLTLATRGQVLTAQSAADVENYTSDIFIQTGIKQHYHDSYLSIIQTPVRIDTAMVRETNYPSAALGYRKFFGKLISVSFAAIYNSGKREEDRVDSKYSLKIKEAGIMASTQLYWFRRPAFKLYTGIGSGVVLSQYKGVHDDLMLTTNSINMDFMISPIGFRFGKKLGITGEYSWGDYGRYQLGLFYNW